MIHIGRTKDVSICKFVRHFRQKIVNFYLKWNDFRIQVCEFRGYLDVIKSISNEFFTFGYEF